MSSSTLVLTLIGPDRPGLVDALAESVAAHGGNWLESRMAHLGGKFAGILRLTVPAADEQRLIEHLERLAEQGLNVTIETDVAADDIESADEIAPLTLELIGSDRPGIVKEISHVFADRGVNVEELRTECAAAAMTGKPLFRATARLRLPKNLSVSELQAQLEQVAGDLMVDVALR